MTIERPEPSFSDTEVGMLRSYLAHFRATIRLQASGLTDAQLDQPLPPSDLTLGGMLKHLAFVEDYWFSYNLAGNEPSPPWDTAPWDDDADWDWHSAAGAPHAELDALLADAIARSDACLDAALAADPDLGRHVALGSELVRRFEYWTVMRDPVGTTYCITGRSPETGLLP